MTTLRERLAQMGKAIDVAAANDESEVAMETDVAAALVAVADAATRPSTYQDDLHDALSTSDAFSAARGPTSKALDRLAAALGVSR